MPWVTPSTRATGADIGYVDFVDEIINNVRELFYRPADGMGSHMDSPSTSVAGNEALNRAMHAIEVGGINDYTTVDSIASNPETVHAGGGPGAKFTIPKNMTGLWAIRVVAGSTMAGMGVVQAMWTLNSTAQTTGYPAPSTSESFDYIWTYRWGVTAGMCYPLGYSMPSGVIVERFTEGDEIRVYTSLRVSTGRIGAGAGTHARFYAQFLGSTR